MTSYTKSETRFELSKQTRHGHYSMHSPHEHSYYEMFYLIDGSCDLMVAEHVYCLTPGTLIFIPKDTLHQTSYPDHLIHTRLYIEFTENYIDDLTNWFGTLWLNETLFNRVVSIPDSLRPYIDSILDNISCETKKQDTFSPHITKMYFNTLLLSILRFHPDFGGSSHVKGTITDKSIQYAINYVEKNYQQNIVLSEIAHKLHLNDSYFSKKFKTVMGIGFKEYLVNFRINKAEKLLLETNINITEIAFKCGYENSNYFGDAFKKKNKVSPSEFRRLKGNIL